MDLWSGNRIQAPAKTNQIKGQELIHTGTVASTFYLHHIIRQSTLATHGAHKKRVCFEKSHFGLDKIETTYF
jgi:hypothetical protein